MRSQKSEISFHYRQDVSRTAFLSDRSEGESTFLPFSGSSGHLHSLNCGPFFHLQSAPLQFCCRHCMAVTFSSNFNSSGVIKITQDTLSISGSLIALTKSQVWVGLGTWSIHPRAKFLSIYGPVKLENKFSPSEWQRWDGHKIWALNILIQNGRNWKKKRSHQSKAILANSIKFQGRGKTLHGLQFCAPYAKQQHNYKIFEPYLTLYIKVNSEWTIDLKKHYTKWKSQTQKST